MKKLSCHKEVINKRNKDKGFRNKGTTDIDEN
jgi:hypothetical protein